MSTLLEFFLSQSKYPTVCFIHSSSSLSVKSSLACAPLDSFLCSAECMVMAALISKFSSSSVSIKSVFQTRDLSFTFTSPKASTHLSTSSQPSARVSWVLKTAAFVCMLFCRLFLSSAVLRSPALYLILSSLSRQLAPASSLRGLWGLPGFMVSSTRRAQALPKTTMSRRELAPSLLAPWTLAQAASPAAMSPGTVASGSSLVGLTTSPW
mmetsp:Transcript_12755/g.33023  ORF Transcript_12755/g.33023 Transcript_12755/m.33023 type:complete len:210 (+) Transcript_12755:855-1484(+)